jgi:hypothetical protein
MCGTCAGRAFGVLVFSCIRRRRRDRLPDQLNRYAYTSISPSLPRNQAGVTFSFCKYYNHEYMLGLFRSQRGDLRNASHLLHFCRVKLPICSNIVLYPANVDFSAPFLAFYLCMFLRNASQDEIVSQICSFAYICFTSSIIPNLLHLQQSPNRVAVMALSSYILDHLESHMTVWDPSLMVQVSLAIAKSWIFYVRVVLIWGTPILLMAISARDPVGRTPVILYIIWQIGNTCIFVLAYLLVLRFAALPWWAGCRVVISSILLNTQIGLCLAESTLPLHGVIDGVSFVLLLLSMYFFVLGFTLQLSGF